MFTPGGDVVYSLDSQKQQHWHLQLCAMLQDTLGLAEPPHFLVSCYAATLDRWVDPRTQQVHLSAEAHPRVLRHRALLNAMFGIEDCPWQLAPTDEAVCNDLTLSTYRQQFPQLWENHDLVARLGTTQSPSAAAHSHAPQRDYPLDWNLAPGKSNTQGYVLRLYVSGSSSVTSKILQRLHELLDQALQQPYTLKVVDIRKAPEQAEADQITATPTLVKVYPPPVRRLVGDFNSLDSVVRMLISLDL